MNNIKGYGFRPSDEELIGYLEDIAFDRGYVVQYITQLQDICQFEPWELPGLSVLQPGCKVWYFIYSLNYKYNKGKLIKRDTKEGYWKPTGRLRKIKASDSKAEIGSKRSLVFHKGRPTGKNTKKHKSEHKNNITKTEHENNRDRIKHGRNSRNKAVWVMHEYQLNTATPPNQKTFFLGKLMKQSEEGNISNNKGESSHDSPSNLRNQVANDATTPENQSDSNKPLPEVEESNDSNVVQHESSTNKQDNDETYPLESSNQHDFVDKNEVYNLSSNSGNYAAVDAISKDLVDTNGWLIPELESPNGSAVVPNQFSTGEHGDLSQNLIVNDNNKTYPEATSKQHDDAENFDSMDLSNYYLCDIDEILKMMETDDNCKMLQNQSNTNVQDAETWNSLA